MAPTALEFGYSCLVPVISHNCINPAANLIWLFRWAFFSYKGCSQTVADPPQLTRNSLRTLLPNPTVLTANTLKTLFSGLSMTFAGALLGSLLEVSTPSNGRASTDWHGTQDAAECVLATETCRPPDLPSPQSHMARHTCERRLWTIL